MVDQVPGVVLGAVDEARLAPAQEVQPDPVHPGSIGDHPSVVAEAAPVVEDRKVQP